MYQMNVSQTIGFCNKPNNITEYKTFKPLAEECIYTLFHACTSSLHYYDKNIDFTVGRARSSDKTLTHCIHSDYVFLNWPPFNHASMRLLYWVSYYMSNNLWQCSINLENVPNRLQCGSDILTDSFSTETK